MSHGHSDELETRRVLLCFTCNGKGHVRQSDFSEEEALRLCPSCGGSGETNHVPTPHPTAIAQ